MCDLSWEPTNSSNAQAEDGYYFERSNGCVFNDDGEFWVQEYVIEQNHKEGGVCKRKGWLCLSSDEDEDEDEDWGCRG